MTAQDYFSIVLALAALMCVFLRYQKQIAGLITLIVACTFVVFGTLLVRDSQTFTIIVSL